VGIDAGEPDACSERRASGRVVMVAERNLTTVTGRVSAVNPKGIRL